MNIRSWLWSSSSVQMLFAFPLMAKSPSGTTIKSFSSVGLYWSIRKFLITLISKEMRSRSQYLCSQGGSLIFNSYAICLYRKQLSTPVCINEWLSSGHINVGCPFFSRRGVPTSFAYVVPRSPLNTEDMLQVYVFIKTEIHALDSKFKIQRYKRVCLKKQVSSSFHPLTI